MTSADSQAAMQAAKDAVHAFMIKNGHHDTSVHEVVRPAIYHETISRTEHEIDETVVSREVHQDHFHTSIQPITDAETLEEQHIANVLPVETKTFEHDDREEVQRRLDSEMSKFRSHTEHVEGEKTHEVVPVQQGEHVHHHVREVIVPVVNRHVIEPRIVHKIVQIHEVHHQAAKHHLTSALPAVSMSEFKKQGGILTGREERYDWFEGEPRSVGGNVGSVNTAISGSPAVPSSQGGHGQAAHQGGAEHPSSLAPTQHQASAGGHEPPIPVPQRRTTMQQAQTQSSQPQAAPTQQQQPTQAHVPAINAPDQAQSQTPSAPTQSSQPAPPSPGSANQPTPSAQAMHTAPQTTGTPAHPASATSSGTTGTAGAAPGRWSLLPMHFARSDDAFRAGQSQHPPTRSTSATRPNVAGTQRPSTSAAAGAQQGAQGGAAPSTMPRVRWPGDDSKP